MIPRYCTPEMSAIWSNESRMALWFEVEAASVYAYEKLGRVPAGTFKQLQEAGHKIDFAALFARALVVEEQTRHDVIAFLTALEEQIGDLSRHVHFGLTSSDIVDTAFALQLVWAGQQLKKRLTVLRSCLYDKALEHRALLCMGRTHGQSAEVTTFGLKLLGFVAEVDRDLERLEAAIVGIGVGKLSGAVGNYANSDPAMEALALSHLGLRVDKVATQVVSRDHHAQFFATLAIMAGTFERLAVEIRLLAHGEIREAFEPFGKGQRGSSAMPHKRNPILTENVTGLCRLIRGYASTAFENQALWHERDISHSAVERVIAPDATQAMDFVITRMEGVVRGLEVDAAQMKRHVDATQGAIFSEAILLALVAKGVMRQEAYGWVQSATKKQKEQGLSLEDALMAENAIAEHLSATDIKALCDLKSHLKHVDVLFDRFALAR